MTHVIFTISGTIIAWAIVLGALFFTRNTPPAVFIGTHYIIDVLVFSMLVYVLRTFGAEFSPAVFTSIIVGVLLILEIFYWVFVNPAGVGQYLTVVDWLIPAILVAGTVYMTALYSR